MAVPPSVLEHVSAAFQELFWDRLVTFVFQPWTQPFIQDAWLELLGHTGWQDPPWRLEGWAAWGQGGTPG